MQSVIDTYNDSSDRALNHKTPNEVFNNPHATLARHCNNMVHNNNTHKSAPFKENDKFKAIAKKEKFDKGKQNFSKDIHTDKKEEYKLI